MSKDADSQKAEAGYDESARNRSERINNKNGKKEKGVHFGNLTVEEGSSKIDIDSNVFTLTTVVFRGSTAL